MKRGALLITILVTLAIVLSACSSSGAAVKCKTVDKVDQSKCYIDTAIENKDISICKQAEGRGENWCKFEVSKAIDDVNVCKDLKSDQYWADICYKYFGETHANKDYCNSVIDQSKNNECLSNAAIDSGDPNLCKDIQGDETSLEKCKYDSAVSSLNPLNCDRLDNPINRDTCVSKIAKAKDDPSLCNAIRFDEVKQSCMDKFADDVSENN